MLRHSLRLSLLATATLGAAAIAAAPEEVVQVGLGSDWRRIATEADRSRVYRWRDVWVDALAQARRGNAADITAGGALFEPDAALPGAQPPPGLYACRTVKLGRPRLGGVLDYVEYPADRCRVSEREGRLHFTKLTGAQRPAGTIFPDNGRRMVFLGTLILGDESQALRYSRDRERDLIAIIERVGPDRWRMTFPRPRHESLLDVIELTPSR